MRNIDYDYVNMQKRKNDFLWQNYEKSCYYTRENEKYILPTIVICILVFFTFAGIIGDIIIVCFVLYLCHCNNVKLDSDYRILMERKKYREYRRKQGESV